MEKDLVALYSITAHSRFYQQLLESVKSLRTYNQSLVVHVFIYGVCDFDLTPLRDLGVRIHQRKEFKGFYPYLVKWKALRSVRAQRVLLLDADTYFYSDPQTLVDRYQAKDIYGRIAIACRQRSYRMGHRLVRRHILPRELAKYHAFQGTDFFPIFNAGVLLFNRGLHQRIHFQAIVKAYNLLMSGRFPYPSKNTYNRGELALSLVLAQLAPTAKEFSPSDAPYFTEWAQCGMPRIGSILHIFSENYAEFKRDGWDRGPLPEPVKDVVVNSPQNKVAESIFEVSASMKIIERESGNGKLVVANANTGEIFRLTGLTAQLYLGIAPGVVMRDVFEFISPGANTNFIRSCAKIVGQFQRFGIVRPAEHRSHQKLTKGRT